MGRAPVRAGHGSRDREPEAGTPARARLVGAREALEGAREELRWEPGSLVADVQLDAAVLATRAEHHAPVPVGERIVDEVRQRLLDPRRIGVERDALGR